MMADYNIYIHDISGGNSGFSIQTQAWQGNESGQTKAWMPSIQQTEEGGGKASFSAPSFSAMRGISQFAKAHPVVAAAVVVVTVATKVLNQIEPFVTKDTGDYRFSTAWGNMKSAVGMVMNPIGTAMNQWRTHIDNANYNKKQEQERLLIGEGYTNSSTRRV